MFIQPTWPAPPQIKAYTTLRDGGVSQPPYHSFNLAFHVEDNSDHVTANRKQLINLLHLPSEPIWINQVHGTTMVEASPDNKGEDADASFTTAKNQICAIMTADCLPILCCNKQGNYVSALHAGWRGLAGGIIGKNLQQVAGPDLLVWLGPAIGPGHFEVGQEVYEIFTTQRNQHQSAFTRYTDKTWLANIYELARLQLINLGITHIYGGDYCTYAQPEYFFSYRRDKGKTGRMASLIWIDN
jgi:polyphenol oxidase